MNTSRLLRLRSKLQHKKCMLYVYQTELCLCIYKETRKCSSLSQLSGHTHNHAGVSILHTPSCTCFTSWKTKFPMSYKLFMGSYEQSLCRDNAITLVDDYFTVRGRKSASAPWQKNSWTVLGCRFWQVWGYCLVFYSKSSRVVMKFMGRLCCRQNNLQKLHSHQYRAI